MLEQATLRERFAALLEQERQALGIYESLARDSTNPAVRKQALQLHKEKERHVRLAERLLEIVD